MNTSGQFERDLERWLQAKAPASAPAGFHASVMDRARTLRQRPAWTTTLPARRFSRGRGMTLLAAATLLLVGGVLAAGSGAFRVPSVVPPVSDPSFGPVAVASPDAASPGPSQAPSTSPGPSDALLTWRSESLHEDWPGPVRTEPAGRPIVVPILLTSVVHGTCPDCSYSATWGHLADPTGDNGSAVDAEADIRDVTFCGSACLRIGFVSDPLGGVDPRQQWIAYGVVVDTDGDGVPDWRYGIDNEPIGTPGAYRGSSPYRWWRTDLHTGRTESTPNEAWWEGEGNVALFWGNHGAQSGGDGLSFGDDAAGRGEVGSLPRHFYTWASVIQDGRVVATDYAPDAGWLVPSPNAKP